VSDETRRVLELLSQGRVTVDEADQLLHHLADQRAAITASAGEPRPGGKPRFIRIQVRKPGKDGREVKDVSIRVPMAVVRGGMRLSTMIPGLHERANARFRERGIDFDFSKLDPASVESMLGEMGEINIDIAGSGEQIRITAE
jgi:hypothetical protein